MKSTNQKPTSDIATLKSWHDMAQVIHSDSAKQNDEMISFLASMLSAQIYERLGEQEANELRAAAS